MTAPIVAGQTPVLTFTLSGTSTPMTLPAGIVAGERLVMIVAWDNDNNATITMSIVTGVGWTIKGQTQTNGVNSAVLEKLEAAGNSSDALTLAFSGMTIGEVGSVIGVRIAGNIDPAQTLELGVQTHAGTPPGTISTDINPPSLSPSWGSATTTLYMAVGAWDNATRTLSSYPSTYADNRITVLGSAGSNGVGIAMATRGATAPSEDPGLFVISSADQWNGWTLAFKPLGSGGGATGLTLDGPSNGTVGVASGPFTVGFNGAPPSTAVLVTPNDGGDGGTFSPTSASIGGGGPASASFTYTAANAGSPTATINITNDGGLANPTGIGYSASLSSSPISFNGPVPTVAFIVGVPSSFNLAPYFSGTLSPFTFALDGASAALPSGVTLNSAGLMSWSGTGTAGTTSGVIVQGADTGANQADTNAFSLAISVVSNSIRLQPGVFWPRGGEFAQQTLRDWWVFAADSGALLHSGFGGTSDAAGVFRINISDSALAVGDQCRFVGWLETADPVNFNKTVRMIGGYLQALAQV